MPQLDPFYYTNTSIISFIVLIISVYFLSKYILPNIIRLFIARKYLYKLI